LERAGSLGEGGGVVGAAFAIANNSKRMEKMKMGKENMTWNVQVLAAGEHSGMDCQQECREKYSRITLRQPLKCENARLERKLSCLEDKKVIIE
jgi:hypothetical protein